MAQAKDPKKGRVPSAVGAIPVVGDLMKSADAQAQWMQDLLEQNARLVGQLPATIKTFNDTLERFNQTVGRLDRAVSRIEAASKSIAGPVERLASTLERILALGGDLPGAGVVRRITGARSEGAGGAAEAGGPVRPRPRRAPRST